MPIPIHNSTHIKDSILHEISTIVKPSDIPNINSITVRSKAEGKIEGNWGKFYPHDYRITICMPSVELYPMIDSIRPITKISYTFKTVLDFLAAVIGHEYYHAWQWINEKELFHVKDYIEVGAEKYESVAVKLWNDHLEKIGVYDAVARRGK